MEDSCNGCPTDILVDLKEDDFMPSYQKAMKYIENIDNDSFESELKQEKYQCIMDMSPFRLRNECREPAINSLANSEKVSDGAVDDCPTAVLIDVPNSSERCPKKHSLRNCKSDSHQEETLIKFKSLDQDIDVKEYNCFRKKKYSAIEDFDNPSSLFQMNQLSPPRLRLRSPSPQSMTRITKEASKIVHTLNSSALLYEDSLLCEEILPIPINFDNFDLDDNSDQETLVPKTENSSANRLSNHTSSVSIQTEQEVINTEISKIVLDSPSSVSKNVCSSSKCQNYLTRCSSEPLKKREDSSQGSITSEELQSLEIQGGSHDNSEVFVSNEKTNDVFDDSLTSVDEENIQERKDEKVLSSKAEKKNSRSLKEMEKRPKLRNLANVKNNSNSRFSPSTNKINSTSHLSSNSVQNSKLCTKDIQFHGKQRKKTTLADSQRMPNLISRSNSFQYDNTRRSISSFQQTNSSKQKPSLLSGYKSSSSDVKHAFTEMKTPSKRYSIATPLQNASTKKSTLTPVLSRIQNPSNPRFTPQSAGVSRLSFSKSWQPPNSRGFKNLNTIPTPSAVGRPSLCGTYSSKLNKQDLNQSISFLPSQTSKNNFLSTTSKKRCCSKLNMPSPLLTGQERKLSRPLFPSMPPK